MLQVVAGAGRRVGRIGDGHGDQWDRITAALAYAKTLAIGRFECQTGDVEVVEAAGVFIRIRRVIGIDHRTQDEHINDQVLVAVGADSNGYSRTSWAWRIGVCGGEACDFIDTQAGCMPRETVQDGTAAARRKSE